MHERLATGERGRFTPAELLDGRANGTGALGWPDAGRLSRARPPTSSPSGSTPSAPRAPPRPRSSRARPPPTSTTVVVGGDVVVSDGRHRLGDVGAMLPAPSSRVAGRRPREQRSLLTGIGELIDERPGARSTARRLGDDSLGTPRRRWSSPRTA